MTDFLWEAVDEEWSCDLACGREVSEPGGLELGNLTTNNKIPLALRS